MTQGLEVRGTAAHMFIGSNWETIMLRHREASYEGVSSAVVCLGVHSCVPGKKKSKKSKLCSRSVSWQKYVEGIRVTGQSGILGP